MPKAATLYLAPLHPRAAAKPFGEKLVKTVARVAAVALTTPYLMPVVQETRHQLAHLRGAMAGLALPQETQILLLVVAVVALLLLVQMPQQIKAVTVAMEPYLPFLVRLLLMLAVAAEPAVSLELEVQAAQAAADKAALRQLLERPTLAAVVAEEVLPLDHTPAVQES